MIKKENFVATLVFTIVIITIFSPYLFFGKTFIPFDMKEWVLPWASEQPPEVQVHYNSDVFGEIYPQKHFLKTHINQFTLPLWNKYNFFGVSQISISTTIYFDIFNLLYFISTSLSMEAVIVVIKLIFAGLFMFILMRYYGLSMGGAFLSGIAFIFSGGMRGEHLFYWGLGSFLWLPLVIYFLERSLQSINSALLFNISAGLTIGFAFLGGHIQNILHFSLAVFLWGSARLLLNKSSSTNFISQVKSVAFSLLLAYGLGLAISAVSWLPTLELYVLGFSRTYDIGLWFNQLSQNLTKIPFIISFLFIHFFGHHKTFSPVLLAGIKWTDYLMGYVGFIPLVFALSTFNKRTGIIEKYFQIITLGTLFIVFLTPLVVILYSRTLIIWCFAVSALAGFGLDQLIYNSKGSSTNRLNRILWWLAITVFILLIIIQLCIWKFGSIIIPQLEFYINSLFEATPHLYGFMKEFYIGKVDNTFKYYTILNPLLIGTLFIICAISLTILLYRKKIISANLVYITVILLTIADLGVFFYQYVPIIDKKNMTSYPETPSSDFLKSDLSLHRIAVVDRAGVDPPIYHFESNIPHKIQRVNNRGSINYQRSRVFSDSLLLKEINSNYSLLKANDNEQIFDLANVKYILAKSAEIDSNVYPLVFDKELMIYENTDVMPRAFVVGQYRVIKNLETVLKAMKDPFFEPRNEVILEIDPGLQLGGSTSEIVSNIMIEHYGNRNIIIKTNTSEDGLLVLTDTNYPGWEAYVDEVKTNIYTGNYLFRVISLPKGSHTVRFFFNPKSFKLGLWISLLSFFIGGGFLLLRKQHFIKK